jgi:hypothetical protein
MFECPGGPDVAALFVDSYHMRSGDLLDNRERERPSSVMAD